MGDKFEPSEDYGVSVIHKGLKLDADGEIFAIFSKQFINNVLLHHNKKNDETHKSLLKTIEPSRETSKKITIVDVEDKNDVKNTSCKLRLNFNLVNDHIASYVMTMISVKSTDPLELEKLCLVKPKLTEIEDLFKMTETYYRKLITLLFVNDNLLKEIDEFLAYNYPITAQECILSVTCENKSSKDSKSSSTPQKSEFVRVNGIFKKIAIIEEEVEGEGEIQVEVLKTGEAVTLTENVEEEKVEVDNSNDEGEKLKVKSGKCTASPSKF